jgi:hypothetical protein
MNVMSEWQPAPVDDEEEDWPRNIAAASDELE